MILDIALAHSVVLESGTKARIKVLKPWIRRYLFNADASHKMGRFAVDCTDIICRDVQAAVRPYPNVYIEIDNHAGIEGAHMKPYPDAAPRVGFLWIETGECYICAGNDHKAEFTPFFYAEHGSQEAGLLARYYKDAADEEDEKFRLNYETFKFLLMIGKVDEPLKESVGKYYKNLTDLYEVGMVETKIPYEILDEQFKENVGVYKAAMSCLFLLNDRIKQQLVHVKAKQKVVNGKLRTVPKHSVVTIDLDVPQIRNVYDSPIGTHDSPIEHEIKQHWAHFQCSSQCSHKWVPYTSEEGTKRDEKYGHKEPLLREVCELCGGRRTLKPVCIAGNPKKGSNVGKKQYRVIASLEKEVIKKLKEKPSD